MPRWSVIQSSNGNLYGWNSDMLGLLKRNPMPRGAAQKQGEGDSGTYSKLSLKGQDWVLQPSGKSFELPGASVSSVGTPQNGSMFSSFALWQTGLPWSLDIQLLKLLKLFATLNLDQYYFLYYICKKLSRNIFQR